MAQRPPTTTTTPAPPTPRPLSPGKSAIAASKSNSYRPFTALSRDRDRGQSASLRSLPSPTLSTLVPDGLSAVSVAESPTQQRLQLLQTKLQSSSIQDRERKAKREIEQESKLVQLDDKLSVLLAGHEAERKRRDIDDVNKTAALEERVEQLQRTLAQLQNDFESEEQTRKTLNSTFAKNFAIKIEERFIKMEALVSSQKRQLAEAEDARVRMMQNFEARLQELQQRLEQEHNARRTRQEDDDENWKRVMQALERLEKMQQDTNKGYAQREESMFGKISAEMASIRQQLEQERAQREHDDEEKMQMINEGIAFIKDGKETWLRMFDYKMMPFKIQRDEDEARERKHAQEVDGRIAELMSKMEVLETGLDEERRAREDELTILSEDIVKETKAREVTEEQISRLLEHTINRIDELQQS